ncbi:MAG: valine--tRNA ligase [Erysipelotrichaceae bacterium]|nr:valine--tRNA ligase [Erysipelotrichaceae bacterium]
MLDKHYDPKKVEEGKYERWVDAGYFKAGQDKSKPPFSLVIPPPNVTGKLHLGHAMNTTYEDIIARYKRMKGYDVLWLPGMDHAGIATQAKVEAKLREQGISRYDLGREAFLKKAWEWKDEYAASIHEQWKKMGLSLDYSRERFTLDEGLSKAVKHVFVTLYREGLIYQGERITNWDPELRTALSNIEIIHQDDPGDFFYFRYDIVDSSDSIIVATTRPETMFGDTAVFVNPKDPRYQKYIGKQVINPANGEKLPLMADSYVDMKFGTGAMKCTPAHDPNDFALAKKYGFPFIKVLDETAHMNEKCGPYQGMDRYECRKALVEKIKAEGHLVKIEKIVHSVGHSERSGAVVEPMLSKQWFVKMKPLADAVLAYQKTQGKVEFLPKRFEKVLLRWMSNIEDWCISRQLWWGHRIPAYYNKKTGELLVSETTPDLSLYRQDEDVLDTWFSSALWPFATMGWPDTSSPDYQRYFPTSVMVTAYDIIFFWVSRMVFDSLHFTGKAPFEKVIIHGLVRDEQGRKMSKSLGNGIDPLEVIDRYGVDALRYFITTNAAPGMDMRYSSAKVASAQAYLNKIWNACRYVEGVLGEDYKPRPLDKKKLGTLDRYLVDHLARTIKKVGTKMDQYQFGQASSTLYDFVYDDFCSSYLEFSKIALAHGGEEAAVTKDVLYWTIKDILLMIYPYAPFVSEEMYLSLPCHLESIMLETYPVYERKWLDKKSSDEVAVLLSMIKDIRNYKSSHGIAPNAKVKLAVSPKEPFSGSGEYLTRFAFASSYETRPDELSGSPFLYPGFEMVVEEDVDPEELRKRLEEQQRTLEFEIARSEKILSNPGFLQKAPKAKVESEQTKLAQNKAMLTAVNEKLRSLKK